MVRFARVLVIREMWIKFCFRVSVYASFGLTLWAFVKSAWVVGLLGFASITFIFLLILGHLLFYLWYLFAFNIGYQASVVRLRQFSIPNTRKHFDTYKYKSPPRNRNFPYFTLLLLLWKANSNWTLKDGHNQTSQAALAFTKRRWTFTSLWAIPAVFSRRRVLFFRTIRFFCIFAFFFINVIVIIIINYHHHFYYCHLLSFVVKSTDIYNQTFSGEWLD